MMRKEMDMSKGKIMRIDSFVIEDSLLLSIISYFYFSTKK